MRRSWSIGSASQRRGSGCYDFKVGISRAEKTLLVSVGARIRRQRQELGISQAVLAAKAGVHTNVIGRTERGTYNPTVLTLNAIAGALNTPIVGLLK
jgi:ribosome-binding protein aMBF1 (putative translation factor)